ncbi:MAG: tRNA (adenosine(37)-N6)-threonylcarbamoyltransferase complex transferase subunit TsaD [Flavobacteriaceae bacterium]|nr:tRNA (adenosine(37)-N6)-threonylcarbamoyltransferase complex transferase subunit TsaD [Flavobacteriaceae bacterium]MDA8758079.1 tRNA (adenosine(37)-N6)-threonylcarbamoyltransferase complex transferase subunit TsaD [Flavobacteriaceae bacterium]MDB2520791.1 tRNA (adenosine(37)-N6)-threonylcarbamoyltransferase complex transferase subunit TsaD [Flavobacteriaceae bacterium]
MKKTSYILGIESSCDDTAAAILKDNQVLSNCIANQKIHQSYGGVVPELASRAHQANIVPVVQQALSIANIDKKELSAIAYTRGPGLLGSLLVGSAFAKSLALSLEIPLIEVNHMQAHLLCHFINNEDQSPPEFPFLGVTLSGGHTQLVLVESHFEMKEIGKTRDDAIGEAFDKCGKIMGLNYPAGPEIDRLAKEGDPNAFDFPIPKVDGLDVSYSGLKTAFINLVNKNSMKNPNFIEENLNDLCASIQKTLVTVIINKIILAKEKYKLNRVVIGGGVAANSKIRSVLTEKANLDHWEVFLPPFQYTTDNAAMIGIVGYHKLLSQQLGTMDQSVSARLSL